MAYKLDDIKVLVVDDMKPMLALTQNILKTFGFKKIFVAASAEEAFDIVCKNDPDFIITDWLMEPTDGLEFTNMIRRNPAAPNPFVPVIMMTGFSSRIRVEAARDCGITEFLVKPFNAKDLYARVFQIIEKPRQFVSTDEFFGPDRRRKRDDGYEGPRRRGEDPNVAPSGPVNAKAEDILKRLSEEAKKI